MLLKKTIIFSLMSIVFAQIFEDNEPEIQESMIQKAKKKLNIEEKSNLFPETNFNTYEIPDNPELQARSLEENYINGQLKEVDIDEGYLDKRSNLNCTEIAIQFVVQNYPNIEYLINTVVDNDESTIASIYMSQALNGIEIRNSEISIGIDRITGSIISTSISVWENITTTNNAVSGGELSLQEAINIANEQLELSKEPVDLSSMQVEELFDNRLEVTGIPFTYDHTLDARIIYIAVTKEKVEKVWELTMEVNMENFVICVSMDTRKVVNLLDLSKNATYRVVPINMPNIGSYSRVTYKNPFYKDASPLGWHNNNSKKFTDTRGNNVLLYENSDGDDSISGNKPISGGKNLKFEFPFDLDKFTVEENQGAAAANAFYVVNMLHDIFYRLGFTEAVGNFQTHNFSGSGKGNDPVEIRISDRLKFNNAQMVVNPDGKKPILRLFPFYDNRIGNERDPAFDNQIIIHEFSHGVSNRMVGGANNVGCLNKNIEAEQLDEGYSDFFADALQYRKGINRNTVIRLFLYVVSDGIRKYPLTSNTKYNNLKYSSLGDNLYIGATVWATMLHEVFWNFIENYKHDPDYFVLNKSLSYDPSNYLAVKFVVDSFRTLPCQPSFIDARDAYITAINSSKYNKSSKKKMRCLAWAGFAKRGLGLNAKPKGANGYKDNFTLPSECSSYENLL